MRIVSFGRCNFRCPYCKRGGQAVDRDGNIIASREFTDRQVFRALEDALAVNQRIRLSGGDPVMYPAESLKIAKWSYAHGRKISLAHNGSSPEFVRKIMPYLDYAAIDLKAWESGSFCRRAGISREAAQKMLENSLAIQKMLSENGVLVDVRTMVFATTSLCDLLETAHLVDTAGNHRNKFLTFRQYKPVRGLAWQPLEEKILLKYIAIVSAAYPDLLMGLRSKWQKGGFKYWRAGQEFKPQTKMAKVLPSNLEPAAASGMIR